MYPGDKPRFHIILHMFYTKYGVYMFYTKYGLYIFFIKNIKYELPAGNASREHAVILHNFIYVLYKIWIIYIL